MPGAPITDTTDINRWMVDHSVESLPCNEKDPVKGWVVSYRAKHLAGIWLYSAF